MAKFRLLNDGEYHGMDKVRFPVAVEGVMVYDTVYVTTEELVRVGADIEYFTSDFSWAFIIGTEIEEIAE